MESDSGAGKKRRLPQIEFDQEGERAKGPGWGLTFASVGGKYAIYYADRFDGGPSPRLHWKANYLPPTGGSVVIGVSKTRAGAEKLCRRHLALVASRRHGTQHAAPVSRGRAAQ